MSDRATDLFVGRGGAMGFRRGAPLRAAYLPPRMDDRARQVLEVGRVRMVVAGAALLLAFGAVGARLTQLAVLGMAGERMAIEAPVDATPHPRADIVDRNGEILATDLATASLYANPRRLLDPNDAARALVTALPDLDYKETLAKLSSGRTFVWLRRNLTPREQWEVNRLGIPGLDFMREFSRVFPHGPLLGHVLGYVDSDNTGIAGLESRYDEQLRRGGEPLRLTIDLRVQYILRDELRKAMIEFKAKSATGMVMDVRTGAVLAMVSLPDFDPNHPAKATENGRFNRATLGVYELGSTFKVFTTAIALDSGVATMNQTYDATEPLKVARFTIRDYHAKKRWLSLPEVFMYSSNIGAARMAADIGGETQQAYLGRLGLLQPASFELPEVGRPIVPSPWRPINTMTIGFGHGIAISPLQLTAGVAAVVNGGIMRAPHLVLSEYPDIPVKGERVFQEETSRRLRELMRMNVLDGTGGKADIAGYRVGGKTGTAEKPDASGYNGKALLSSFIATFPTDDPRYAVLAILDEPQGTKSTGGYATGGWVAAPAVGAVIARMAPILGIAPGDGEPEPRAPARNMDELVDELTEGRTLASYESDR